MNVFFVTTSRVCLTSSSGTALPSRMPDPSTHVPAIRAYSSLGSAAMTKPTPEASKPANTNHVTRRMGASQDQVAVILGTHLDTVKHHPKIGERSPAGPRGRRRRTIRTAPRAQHDGCSTMLATRKEGSTP